MAIAKDATSSAHAQGVSSLSWAHTCTGSDLLLNVHSGTNGTPVSTTGVTYNSVALTSRWSASRNWTAASGWSLVAPATGSNTVAITLSATEDTVFGQAISYTGVDQTTPHGTAASANGATDAPAVPALTSATGEVCIGFVMSSASSITSGAGQTAEISDLNFAADSAQTDSEPGAASVDITWTTTVNPWACGGIPIKPVAAGGTIYTRTLSDSAGVSDAPVRGVKAFRQMPQDALAIAELIARGQMHGRTVADSISISDGVRRAALLFRKENDSAAVNDSTLRFVQMFRRLLDGFDVTDSLAVAITLGSTVIVTRILQDGLSVQDSVMRAVRMYRRESQVVDVLDNSWYSASVVRGLIDTLSVAETTARAMMRGRVVADSVEAVDLAVRYALLYRLLHDDAAASDSMARTITYYQTLIGFVLMSLRNEPVIMAIDEAQPIIMEMRNT